MAELKAIPRKMSNTKLKLSDLNPHLMCVLCGGYYIDATTIVECLHSFCRSCIVKHLENSKYCPICDVQVHKTKPLANIRPDKTLQDIVYKLVPGLFANEMRNRRRFYRERPHHVKPNDSESSGEVARERKIYVNDENITFSLVYREGPGPTAVDDCCREFPPPAHNERRYFKCPTGVTVHHLKKLIRAKYDLSDSNYKLEIYFRDQELHQELTLLDISYVYLWKTKGTLDLTYKIFENVVKRQRVEETPTEAAMETCEQAEVTVQEPAAAAAAAAADQSEKREDEKKQEEKQEAEGEEGEREREEKVHEDAEPKHTDESRPADVATHPPEVAQTPPEPAKENGLAGSEPKEVQLQISESGVMSVSRVEDSEIVRTVEETVAKVTNNQTTDVVPPAGKEPPPPNGTDTADLSVKRPEKKPAGKTNKPYKTIRCSPKTWHPVIPKEKLRPTLMKNSDEPRKPLKFFKMRNMPRFLGNPSTGVKPMFPGITNKPDDKKPDTGKTLNNILKIDPKTLRPIDKDDLNIASTPSAPNLLTNPFIPNNNHFLFSDLHLLPPNSGNFKEKPAPAPAPAFKAPTPNGNYPPICFPTPDRSPATFYPFGGLAKPQPFPFPDKMDPLLRASRLSPFGNLAGFNIAGFHASLPPSISRLLNPHHHFRKMSQAAEKRNKDESTKETTKHCDDSFKVGKGEGEGEGEREGEGEGGKGREGAGEGQDGQEKEKEREREREKEVNGEGSESVAETKSESIGSAREKEKAKDKDR